MEKRTEEVQDALPDFYPYRDEGCEVSPSCLRCPLPMCKYDDPVWFRREMARRRALVIARAIEREGLTASQACRRFGVSRRTVFRILRRYRNGELTPSPGPGPNGHGAPSEIP